MEDKPEKSRDMATRRGPGPGSEKLTFHIYNFCPQKFCEVRKQGNKSQCIKFQVVKQNIEKIIYYVVVHNTP